MIVTAFTGDRARLHENARAIENRANQDSDIDHPLYGQAVPASVYSSTTSKQSR
jgi:hypothetical protein